MQNFLQSQVSKKTLFVFLIFALISSFAFLCGRDLFSGDETRVAGISAGILVNEDWLVPRLNGDPFLEYPPMFYWINAVFLKFFGIEDCVARLPGAISLFFSYFLLYALALRMKFTGGQALLSAVMLLTVNFFGSCRTCMVDSLLSLFVLLSLYGFYSAMERKTSECFLFAFGIAGGIMTKGVPGFLIPCSVAFFFLLIRSFVERKIYWKDWIFSGISVFVSLIPVAVWSLLIYQKLGYKAFYEVAYVNSIGRISGSQGDHVEPFYYYLIKLPEMFQPFLMLIPFGIWRMWKKFTAGRSYAALFTLCYFLIPFLMFTVASAKRRVYLLPLYPAAAILSAAGFCFLFAKLPEAKREKWLSGAVSVLLFILGASGLIIPVFHRTTSSWTYGILLCLIVFTGLLLQKKGYALLLAYALLLPLCEGVFMGRKNKEESLKDLFSIVESKLYEGKEVYLINPMERLSGAAVFYLQTNLPVRRGKNCKPETIEYWICHDKNLSRDQNFGDFHTIKEKIPEFRASSRQADPVP